MFSLFNVSNTVVLAGMVHCRSSVRPLCCTLRSMLWTHEVGFLTTRYVIPRGARNLVRCASSHADTCIRLRDAHTSCPDRARRGRQDILACALAGRILVFNVVTMPAELTLDFQSERKRSESIFGAKGPDDVFVPPSPLRHGTEYPEMQKKLEAELGFLTHRKDLREAANAEFVRATGSIDTLMDRELFVESVGQLWDLDRVSATACFLAGDVDHSNRINAGEWLILREAFFHRSKECASHPAIRKLLLRAALYSYDVCKDGSLSNDFEVLLWLRDLCTGEARLQRIADSLFEALDTSLQRETPERLGNLKRNNTRASLASHSIELIADGLAPGGQLSTWLDEHNLSTDDMIATFLSSHHFGRRVNVVYDGRAETARTASHADCSIVQDLEAGTKTGTPDANQGRASRGKKSGVTTDGVPGYAVNEDLTLHPSLRSVVGWRGPLSIKRSSSLFFLASHVIDVMARHAQQARSAPDIPGDAWQTDGALLEELLGNGAQGQADCIEMLSDACRRVVTAQPTVVRVRAPAKVELWRCSSRSVEPSLRLRTVVLFILTSSANRPPPTPFLPSPLPPLLLSLSSTAERRSSAMCTASFATSCSSSAGMASHHTRAATSRPPPTSSMATGLTEGPIS